MTPGQYQTALGSFTPQVRLLKQRELINSLYDCFTIGAANPEESTEEEEIAVMKTAGTLIHRLLLSFYLEALDVKQMVDSAVEQGLALATMTVECGKYAAPNIITKLIACTARTMLSAYLHSAWHEGVDLDFALEVTPDDLSGDADVEKDSGASEPEEVMELVFDIMVSVEDHNEGDIYEGVVVREANDAGTMLVQSNTLK